MSAHNSVDLLVRSEEAPLNVFSYLSQLRNHWTLIIVAGIYLVRRTYQRTLLGPVWLLGQGVLPMLGMMAVFQHVSKFQTGDLPYPLFLISGMGIWTTVDLGIKRGFRTLNYLRRIKKVIHVPGIAMTFAGLSLPIVYMSFYAILLLGAVAFIWITDHRFLLSLDLKLVFVPVSVVLALMLVVGISAVTSVIFLIARDIRHIGSLLHLWFFLTPIAYPLDVLPGSWRAVWEYANPLVGIVEMYRYGLFGISGAGYEVFLAAAASTISIFMMGVWFMMRSDWILDEIL